MFEYEKDSQGNYWIWSEKIHGKFGPFQGVIVKNKSLGVSLGVIDISKYPGYKYSLGVNGNTIFVVSLLGIQEIIHSSV